VHLFRIPLLGFTAETGHRLLLTVAGIVGILVLRMLVVWLVRLITGRHRNGRTVFWTRQASALTTAILIFAVLVSVWFGDWGRMASFAGVAGAGIAFALQKVITALAGYLVILRGETFTVGDRITMGGVRGDVIDLGFLQTRIMEMGAPKTSPSDDPSWIRERQYTGRMVTVTNDKVFDNPVFNYTREFPYMWEELHLPVAYAHRDAAEKILLEAARSATAAVLEVAEPARHKLETRYRIDLETLAPIVYYELTSKRLELHVRFLTPVRGVRAIKDEIQRTVVARFDEAGIPIGGRDDNGDDDDDEPER
jgi:small-conductance mechanosensitive channel